MQFYYKQNNFNNFLSILNSNISPNFFIFSFFSVKLDKNRKKNSRGKIPNYFLLWKYLPVYKRTNAFLKLLYKELKFLKFNNFKTKLFNLFLNIFKNNKFFIKYYQNFINNLIFKKYMSSLFINYKTKK